MHLYYLLCVIDLNYLLYIKIMTNKKNIIIFNIFNYNLFYLYNPICAII